MKKLFFSCPSDESEVSIVIEKLKNKTFDGHDGSNNRMVKFCALKILPFLTFCFNQSFIAGVFPDIGKIEKILTFYKTGKQTERNSSRPISLLTMLNVTQQNFSTIIHIRMSKFISKCKLLVPEQFGFRRRYSCVHAKTSAMEIMRHCIDDKKSWISGFCRS